MLEICIFFGIRIFSSLVCKKVRIIRPNLLAYAKKSAYATTSNKVLVVCIPHICEKKIYERICKKTFICETSEYATINKPRKWVCKLHIYGCFHSRFCNCFTYAANFLSCKCRHFIIEYADFFTYADFFAFASALCEFFAYV